MGENRMKRAWRVLVLAVSVLAGACTDSDIGTEYIEISEEESGLQFYGPGLAGGYRQILTGQDSHFVRQTIATYGPKSGEFPYARIYFTETPPDRFFARSLPVEDTLEQWFSDKTIEVGVSATAVNAIGRVDFVTATVDGVACVVWLQTFGAKDNTGVGTGLINGFYCRGQGSTMTTSEAEYIVKLVGHREHGAIEPPTGWPDMSGTRIQVIWANDNADVDNYEARIELPTESMDGAIRIVPGAGRDCRGVVSYRGRGEQVITMSWSLSCADGTTAKGTLRQRMYQTSSYLVGDGTDSRGRNVAIID